MIKFLASVAALLVTLLVLWCAAGSASAAELPATAPGLHAYEIDCHVAPLYNGRVGETVRVCDHVRLVMVAAPHGARAARTARLASRAHARTGHTTVVHYGHRAPMYTITYMASR